MSDEQQLGKVPFAAVEELEAASAAPQTDIGRDLGTRFLHGSAGAGPLSCSPRAT